MLPANEAAALPLPYASAGISPVAAIALSRSQLASLKPGDSISFGLLKQHSQLTLDRVITHSDNSVSYLASANGDSLVLTVSNRSYFASFALAGQRFTAQGKGDAALV